MARVDANRREAAQAGAAEGREARARLRVEVAAQRGCGGGDDPVVTGAERAGHAEEDEVVEIAGGEAAEVEVGVEEHVV